jgi:hypothetical protein
MAYLTNPQHLSKRISLVKFSKILNIEGLLLTAIFSPFSEIQRNGQKERRPKDSNFAHFLQRVLKILEL